MSTRTEHIARLTEMSVRAQAIADELASQDDAPMADDLAKKDAHVERLLTDIRGLVQRAEAAERERDAAMQAHADDFAAKDAEIEMLRGHSNVSVAENLARKVAEQRARAEAAEQTAVEVRGALYPWPKYDGTELTTSMVKRLVGDCEVLASQLGDAERERDEWCAKEATASAILWAVRHSLATPDAKNTVAVDAVPRLVRELREERDRLRVASYGERDDWKELAEQRLKELADLKARAVVLPENWREQIFDVTDNAEVEDKWQGVTSLIGSWRAERVPRELRGEV